MWPKNFKFTEDHEWVKVDGDEAQIGLSNHAQDALGDIVFVELPEVGDEVVQGEPFGVVESVKAVSDCYAPLSGTVVKINEALIDNPGLINESPHENGWMIVIEPSDLGELNDLMDTAEYEEYEKTVEH